MYVESQSDPKSGIFSVTPNNSSDLPYTGVVLYIGTGGDVKVDASIGGTEIFKNLPDGSVLPVKVDRVYASGTTATDIIGLY